MTKERKLAIQMWEQIKEALPKWYAYNKYEVGRIVLVYKYQFCRAKKVHWVSYCWLCQYAKTSECSCKHCPLKTCGYMTNGEPSPWQIIMQSRSSLKAKLDACDTIITALKGAK